MSISPSRRGRRPRVPINPEISSRLVVVQGRLVRDRQAMADDLLTRKMLVLQALDGGWTLRGVADVLGISRSRVFEIAGGTEEQEGDRTHAS